MDKQELVKKGFGTKAAYYSPEPNSLAINAPIYMATNYRYSPENYRAICGGEREAVNIYGRDGDPTDVKFSEQMALLEGTEAAVATASGMAAISTVFFGLLKQGDNIVADWNTYRAAHELFLDVLPRFGVTTTFVDTVHPEQVEAAMSPDTRLIYCESISNPNIKIAPVEALADIAHRHGALLAIDNTFATPYVLRPAELGADIVIESATKFIGGHNNAFGGVVATTLERMRQLRDYCRLQMGNIISPFNAWLLLNGVQTLHVRVERGCQSAMKVAQWLEDNPRVERVFYPGLPSHPQYQLACQQMPKFGAMLTFELGSKEAAEAFLFSLDLCSFAASLGGPRTTLQIPAYMSFLDAGAAERAKMGVRDGMVRVSLGLEDVDDIIADFHQALSRI